MDSIDNTPKINDLKTLEATFTRYFSSGNNTSCDCKKKLDIIYLVCFLTEVMKKNKPDKFKSAKDVMSVIFNIDCEKIDSQVNQPIIATAIICDDLLYFNKEALIKPDGYNSAKEIKETIYEYFTEEWMPF